MAKTFEMEDFEDAIIDDIYVSVNGEKCPLIVEYKKESTTPVVAEKLNKIKNAIAELFAEGTTSKDIVIGDESEITDDTKIFFDSNEIGNLGSEVVDTLEGNESYLAPSVRAINDKSKSIYYNLSTYLNSNQFQNITRSKCVKQNGIVNISFFSGYLSANASSNDITLLNNLPNDLIPDTIIDFLVIALGTSNTILGRGYININEHKLMLWFPSVLDTTYRLIFNCSYNVNNNEEV